MAPSPSSGRTPSTRGRGRGRPRLRGRANSLLSGRRRSSTAALQTTPESYTPTGRRRPVYQNGYRPGGAGGGGRYIDHATGAVVPANVYNASGAPGSARGEGRRRPPATPTAMSAGNDGVYKPREEKSYMEFHPGLDVAQVLEVFSAEDVDGPNYKPPVVVVEKSVKIVDVKEEMEPVGSVRDMVESKQWASHHDEDTGEHHRMLEPILGSPVAAYSPALNGTLSTASMNDGDIDMEDIEDINDTPILILTTPGIDKPLSYHTTPIIAIDPALAALTPPPPLAELSPPIPIDPALDHLAQTHTPAITPTEENQHLPPTTPAPSTRPSRRGDDGPTLASLRAHRSNAGKPPSRPVPLSTVRRPRPTRDAQPFEGEKLNLLKPSYRKILPFQFSEFAWSSSVGSTGPYGLNNPPRSYTTPTTNNKAVDPTMLEIGYQQTSLYTRPPTFLRDKPDPGIDEELGALDTLDRVEYDMDEQDDKWLTMHNSHRMLLEIAPVTREVFEITMTKIEKEWVALEKKIPKTIVKPHGAGYSSSRRRRGGGEDGVDGEEEEGSEDSKCAICDDGECENSNAIVFCDGCNLAVHQECYGVPYIPEGQWLCRKCLTIPRQTAHCIFCPNTDGAFKQTTTTRWSHLLCAIWIPEVRLANPAYMEPVDGMELVPKSRWRLTCYICKQKMGACIQCSNKSCFIAFHVTCGRRARLHMKMKNTSGPGAQLEASGLKAYCDKHVPADWRRENDVDDAVTDAMDFYAVTMAGRTWGDSQSAAMALPDPSEEQTPPGILNGGNLPRVNLTFGNKRKRAPVNPKSVWKLPSGAPVIPSVIYTAVVDFLERFKVPNKKEYVAETCKYWTLKREARRGASLLKRLQLQMNSFTSVEVARKNYAGMGHTQGTKKLERRKAFAGVLMGDLKRLEGVGRVMEERGRMRALDVEALAGLVDRVWFPECVLMREVLEKVESFDEQCVFKHGFTLIRDRLDHRLYPTVDTFAMDMTSVLNSKPEEPVLDWEINLPSYTAPMLLMSAETINRKDEALVSKTAERLLKQMKPLLEEAEEAERELKENPAPTPNGEEVNIFEGLKTHGGIDEMEIDIGQTPPIINGNDTPNGMALDDSHGKGDGLPVQDPTEVSSPETPKPNGAASANTDASTVTAGTTVLGYWSDGHPPWYIKDFEPSSLAVVDPYSKATPTPTPRETTPANETDGRTTNGSRPPAKPRSPTKSRSPTKPAPRPRETLRQEKVVVPEKQITDEPTTPQTLMPQRTEVVPKTPEAAPPTKPEHTSPAQTGLPTVSVQKPSVEPKAVEKTELDFADTEDLMSGYRLKDLPSPLGTIDGSNATPPEHEEVQKTDVELPTPADLPAPSNPLATVVANGVVDHENTSVLSDPPDDDEDVDAEGSTESEPAMDRMDVDDEDLDAEGEPDVDIVGSEVGGLKESGEGSPGSSSGGSGRKSRKGMVFARQSNGRFGPMKNGGGGSGRGRGRKKKW